MGLTALDIIVLLLVGGAATLGWLRGFVWELVALIAWAAAIVAIKLLHAPAAAALTPLIGTEAGAAVLAFALIFGIAFLGVRIVGRNLGRGARRSFLAPVDRLLGLGFGALKGLVGATILFLFASLIQDTIHGAASPRPAWMTQSRSYPLLRASSAALVDFVEKRRKA